MSREYPNQPIPGVASVTIHNGKVLLALRGKAPSYGKWGIPGGVVEVGETLHQAIRREVLEETNVCVEPIKLLTVFDSINRDDNGRVRYHYVLFEYLCRYVSGDVKANSDAPDARWVPFEELASLDIMPSTRKFIDKVLKENNFV
jgi:ADP-ribose pyrophosphatase YjhB (NUDIX family)